MRTTPAGGPGVHLDMRPTPMVIRLLVVNFAIWLLFSILVNFVKVKGAAVLYAEWLALDPHLAVFGLRPWTIVTYAFLHDLHTPTHILFNMMGLFFLGPSLERRWGGKGFLQFYLWSVVIAGLASVVLGLLLPGIFGGQVVGASGAIMAILAAFSLVQPEATILLFFVLPIQARWILWIALGIDTVVFFSGSSDLAYHTHLGGAFAAWLLVTGSWRPGLLVDRVRLAWLRRNRTRKASGFQVLPGGKGRDRRDLN